MKEWFEKEGVSIRAAIWALVIGLILFNGMSALNIMIKIGVMLAVYLIADSRIAKKEYRRNNHER